MAALLITFLALLSGLWINCEGSSFQKGHRRPQFTEGRPLQSDLEPRPSRDGDGTPTSFQCPGEGDFPVPGSCIAFVHCEEVLGGGFISRSSECPPQNVFDKTTKTCQPGTVGADCSVSDRATYRDESVGDFSTTRTKRQVSHIIPKNWKLDSTTPSIFWGYERSSEKNIDLSELERKLSGMNAKLEGLNVTILESQAERKILFDVTQEIQKAIMIENEDEFLALKHLEQQVLLKGIVNSLIIPGMIKQRNIGNVGNEGNVEEVNEFIRYLVRQAKADIRKGYEKVPDGVDEGQTKTLVSEFLSLIRNFHQKLDHLMKLPDENKKVELDDYLDFLESSSLEETLYDILNQRSAIPKDVDDVNAVLILDLSFDGLQIFTGILSSIIASNVYLAGTALEERSLRNYNVYMNHVSDSISRMKSTLGSDEEHSLTKQFHNQLIEIGKLPYASNMENLTPLLFGKLDELQTLENEIGKFVLEHSPLNFPEQISEPLQFTEQSGSPPLGQWQKGKEVRYATQFISEKSISPVGEWSEKYKVLDRTNPLVHIPSAPSEVVSRLVYRKFAREEAELVAIVTGKQISFIDTGRDFINAVSKDNKELGVMEMSTLINNGADVATFALENSMSSLHYAALYDNVEALKLLINSGVDINAKALDDLTALHIAALFGSEGAAEYLIEEGAYINNQSKTFGWSPLHIAAFKNQVRVCEILLKNGAFINIKDGMGLTPLHHSVAAIGDTMELLLADEAIDVNAKDNDGQTPLHYATRSSSELPTKQLLQHASVERNVASDKMLYPLHYAAMSGNIDIIRQMTNNSVSPFVFDGSDSTPLHYSAFFGSIEATYWFLLYNLSLIPIQNKAGHTAFDLASQNDKGEILGVLNTNQGKEDNPDDALIIPEVAEPENLLPQISCTQSDIQNLAFYSEEACSQIAQVENYVQMVAEMIPVSLKPFETNSSSSFIQGYNNAVQAAKININLWRNGDSILNGIQETFRLVRKFEISFDHHYGIYQERIAEFSSEVNKNASLSKLYEEISSLESELVNVREMSKLAKTRATKQYFQSEIRDIESKLQAKKLEVSLDPTISQQLNELTFFLGLVHQDAQKVKEAAFKTKNRVFQFNVGLKNDVNGFSLSAQEAKNALKKSQLESVKNNEALLAIQRDQTHLESEVSSMKQDVYALYDRINENYKRLRQERRELLGRIDRSVGWKFLSMIASMFNPDNMISRYLMKYAETREQQAIRKWQDNINESKRQAERLKGQIEKKEKTILHYREIIANNTRNSRALTDELHSLNVVDFYLKDIADNFPSRQVSLNQIITFLQKTSNLFLDIENNLREIIDIGEGSTTQEEIQHSFDEMMERLITLQCHWKDSSLFIAKANACSK